MPRYLYRCTSCQIEKEMIHSMSECDNPTPKTIQDTSCNHNTCPNMILPEGQEDKRWETVPQGFSFGTFSSMNREDQGKALKKRSKEHFQKELKEKKHEMDKAIMTSLKP